MAGKGCESGYRNLIKPSDLRRSRRASKNTRMNRSPEIFYLVMNTHGRSSLTSSLLRAVNLYFDLYIVSRGEFRRHRVHLLS
jgi:hypothetical protein